MQTLNAHPARTVLQALDAYEAGMEKFVLSGRDLALYEPASQKLDEVRGMRLREVLRVE